MKKNIIILLSFFIIYKNTFCNFAEEIFKNIFSTIDKFINFPIIIFNGLLMTSESIIKIPPEAKLVILSISLSLGALALCFEIMNQLYGDFSFRKILFRMGLTSFCILNTSILVLFSNALYYKIISSLFPTGSRNARLFDILQIVQNIFNDPNTNSLGKALQVTFILFFSITIGLFLFFICCTLIVVIIQKQILEIFLPIYASGVGNKSTEHYLIDGFVKHTSYNIALLTIQIFLFLLNAILSTDFLKEAIIRRMFYTAEEKTIESITFWISNGLGLLILVVLGLFTLGFKSLSGKYEAALKKRISNRKTAMEDKKKEAEKIKAEKKEAKLFKKNTKKGKEKENLKKNLMKVLAKLRLRNLIGNKDGNKITKADFTEIMNSLKNLKNIKKQEKEVKALLGRIDKEMKKEQGKVNKGLKNVKNQKNKLEQERDKLKKNIERNLKGLKRVELLEGLKEKANSEPENDFKFRENPNLEEIFAKLDAEPENIKDIKDIKSMEELLNKESENVKNIKELINENSLELNSKLKQVEGKIKISEIGEKEKDIDNQLKKTLNKIDKDANKKLNLLLNPIKNLINDVKIISQDISGVKLTNQPSVSILERKLNIDTLKEKLINKLQGKAPDINEEEFNIIMDNIEIESLTEELNALKTIEAIDIKIANIDVKVVDRIDEVEKKIKQKVANTEKNFMKIEKKMLAECKPENKIEKKSKKIQSLKLKRELHSECFLPKSIKEKMVKSLDKKIDKEMTNLKKLIIEEEKKSCNKKEIAMLNLSLNSIITEEKNKIVDEKINNINTSISNLKQNQSFLKENLKEKLDSSDFSSEEKTQFAKEFKKETEKIENNIQKLENKLPELKQEKLNIATESFKNEKMELNNIKNEINKEKEEQISLIKTELEVEMNKEKPKEQKIQELQEKIIVLNMGKNLQNVNPNERKEMITKLKAQITQDKENLKKTEQKIQIKLNEQIKLTKIKNQVDNEVKMIGGYTKEIITTMNYNSKIFSDDNLITNNLFSNNKDLLSIDNLFDNKLLDEEGLL